MSALTPTSSLLSARRAGRAGSLRQVVRQKALAWFAGLWSALEAEGQRRAAPHLLSQARRLETDQPGLAAALRALAALPDTAPAATAA